MSAIHFWLYIDLFNFVNFFYFLILIDPYFINSNQDRLKKPKRAVSQGLSKDARWLAPPTSTSLVLPAFTNLIPPLIGIINIFKQAGKRIKYYSLILAIFNN